MAAGVDIKLIEEESDEIQKSDAFPRTDGGVGIDIEQEESTEDNEGEGDDEEKDSTDES